jgi:hypothetical protein
LLILDYKTQFCAKFDLKPMSRVFFAMVWNWFVPLPHTSIVL